MNYLQKFKSLGRAQKAIHSLYIFHVQLRQKWGSLFFLLSIRMICAVNVLNIYISEYLESFLKLYKSGWLIVDLDDAAFL